MELRVKQNSWNYHCNWKLLETFATKNMIMIIMMDCRSEVKWKSMCLVVIFWAINTRFIVLQTITSHMNLGFCAHSKERKCLTSASSSSLQFSHPALCCFIVLFVNEVLQWCKCEKRRERKKRKEKHVSNWGEILLSDYLL